MGRSIGRKSTEDDPLARATAPPANESAEARAERLREEAIAKKRSDEIDARIAAENSLRRKKGSPVKLLLLGQSESGKSTTLKNFQLTYAKKAWIAEKEAWKAVIQLNLVRSVNTILEALSRELDLDFASHTEDFPDDDNVSIIYPRRRPAPTSELIDADSSGRPGSSMGPLRSNISLTDKHRGLVERLAPLRVVQAELEGRLGSGAEEEDQAVGSGEKTSALNEGNVRSRTRETSPPENVSLTAPNHNDAPQAHEEFFVRSFGWKSALQKLRPKGSSGRASIDGPEAAHVSDGVSKTLARMAGDMQTLWSDVVVKEVVRARKVRLMDCSDFYLDNIPRIAHLRYSPSDDDVIRARLRTIGVQEHRIVLDSGPEPGREWHIFDVGGSRTSRAAWPAYFDDVHAILFLAPVSGFDERLREDRRVNRLDDSLQLWKVVCGHRLLRKTELVLFLNKTDVLERKIADGVKFSSYVKSYEGPNNADEIARFLKQKFTDVCRHYSKEARGLHVHFTSVIDTKATAKTLSAVQDGVMRRNLQDLSLI